MGRTALMLVMGFSTMFIFFGRNLSSVSMDAFSNAIDYYENTQRYNVAVAGANIACNRLFLNRTWRDGFSNVPFNGGTFSVSVTDEASDVVKIVSVGTFESTTQTITILMRPSQVSKFAMYAGNTSNAAKFRTGDTIDGPFQCNNALSTQGNPVFIGKATMGSLHSTSGTPTFIGGYETGVSLAFPTYTPYADTIKTSATSSGFYQNGGELWLDFQSNGKVKYKTSQSDPWSGEIALSTFAPNGKICINNGELHVQGTVNGNVTLASTVTSTTPDADHGATYIEGNLTYAADPLTGSSDDMLGLVSAGDIQINTLPIRMDGSFFTDTSAKLKSSLANDPIKQLKVVGALVARNISSNDFGTGATKGANMYMKYDSRLESSPPSSFPFPSTQSFEILSWHE